VIPASDFGVTPSWFVVLPDDGAAGDVAAASRRRATRQLNHASGRPWLLGCWAEGTMTSGRAGETAIAVIGQHAVTADQLVSAAERIRAITDLEQLAASLVGSSHLVASAAGRVRVQGTITGLRGVFYTIGGAVAADRARHTRVAARRRARRAAPGRSTCSIRPLPIRLPASRYGEEWHPCPPTTTWRSMATSGVPALPDGQGLADGALPRIESPPAGRWAEARPLGERWGTDRAGRRRYWVPPGKHR